MPRFPGRVARLLALSLILSVFLVPEAGTALAAGSGGPNCRYYLVPVAAEDGGPPQATAFGQLCYAGPRPPHTVRLPVQGIATNHLYWDFPIDNARTTPTSAPLQRQATRHSMSIASVLLQARGRRGRR
jgi:hypothetical protein